MGDVPLSGKALSALKMASFGRQGLRQGLARCARVGFALGLMMSLTPLAFGQKVFKCPDGKGGSIFQQSPCPETSQEVEARAKELVRLKEEDARKKEETARKKAEQISKGKERDKAYQQQMEERAADARKTREAEKLLREGTTLEKSDGSLTSEVEALYPGPWRDAANPAITAAFAKAKTKGCEKFRYRQRAGGGSGEFLVHCTTDGTNWVEQYFVWLTSGTVKGPYKL